MLESFCTVCCTEHQRGQACPAGWRARGPEYHGWAVAVDALRGVELYGVLVAPTESAWRARIVTYPRSPWTVPGGRGPLKFLGSTAEEAEAKALELILRRCSQRGQLPRDGFGPWDHPDGPSPDRPAPRKRRSLAVRYGTAGPTTLSTTWDLSPSGMFVTAIAPSDPGTVFDVEIQIFDGVARMRGAVAWTRRLLEAGRPRGMGVRLLDPPPVYKMFVRSLR